MATCPPLPPDARARSGTVARTGPGRVAGRVPGSVVELVVGSSVAGTGRGRIAGSFVELVVAMVVAVALGASPAAASPPRDDGAGDAQAAARDGRRAPRAPVWHRDDLPHARPATTPARIVSLAPVVTETLFLLGAGGRVVGDTRFCDRPEAAKRLPKVGGYVDISLERVLELKPDLVVAMPSLGQRDVLDRLRERGVPVLVVFADTLGEVRGLTETLGDVVGAPDKARGLERDLDDAAARLRALRLPPLKAAVVVGTDPIVVAGPGTFAAEVVALSGLASAVSPRAPMWPTWSPESFAATGVQVLVAAEGPAARDKLTALVARAFPRGRRPVVVAADHAVLMRPGPALVDDLAVLARLLHDAPLLAPAVPSGSTSPSPSAAP